jgi:hypothetical protein
LLSQSNTSSYMSYNNSKSSHRNTPLSQSECYNDQQEVLTNNSNKCTYHLLFLYCLPQLFLI